MSTASIPHDKPDQLQKVLAGLIQNEQVFAVYDCIGRAPGSSVSPTSG
jgi:hypothetical protein